MFRAATVGAEHVVDIVVVVQRQAELLQIVLALGPAARFAGLLDSGQQQGDSTAMIAMTTSSSIR